MSWFRVGLFLSVVTTIVAAIHYYLWARLVRDPDLPQPWDSVGTSLLLVLALALPTGLILRRLFPPAIGSSVVWALSVWMGLMFLLLSTLVVVDVGWVVLALGQQIAGVEPPLAGERAMTRFGVGSAVATTAGLALVGLFTALGPVGTKRVRIALPRLPRSLSGLRIVQLSDVHVGPTIGRTFVEELVSRVNALEPDIVAITGDLVDGPVELYGDAVAPLRDLRTRFGVFFVTGNHEYYSGVEGWLRFLPSLGVRVLRNERVTVGKGDSVVEVAGVDDWSSGGMGDGHGPDLERALAGRVTDRPVILLAHQPKAVAEASALGVDLQLSGHTHGGQIFPFRLLVRLAQPYVSGLHRHGHTLLYVSNGTGYWGPPMRVGAPPEITLIELVCEGDGS